MPAITSFIKHHYRHFNAAALVDAAEAYNNLLASGGKMFVTIGGAMSTAELGLSLRNDPPGQDSRHQLHRRKS
jgi:deoxyhypusine synthase